MRKIQPEDTTIPCLIYINDPDNQYLEDLSPYFKDPK